MINIDIEKIHKQQKEYLGSEKVVNKIQPVVSVFVTTYNHVEFIAECLESILMQKTEFPIEIVIGEDESSDGTRQICIEYADKYPNKIRLFLRDRKQTIIYNGSSTFKKSINGLLTLKACIGKYIALCEGDDYWTDPYKLQKQVDFLEANPNFSLVFHDSFILQANKLIEFYGVNCLVKPLKKEIFNLDDLIEIDWFIPTVSIVFKRHIIDNYPKSFFNVYSGDIAITICCLKEGPAKFLNEKMSVYRMHKNGISNTINQIALLEKRIYQCSVFDEYTEKVYQKHFAKLKLLYKKPLLKLYIKKYNLIKAIILLLKT